jgi:hypothetical protein
MSCSGNQYFIGQGRVYMRAIGDDCSPATESFYDVGDADEFIISPAPSYNSHYESQSGLRRKAARWVESIDTSFTLGVRNFNAKNLVTLLRGTDDGVVAAGSVVDEQIAVPSTGWVWTQYQGISAVTVTSNTASPVTLVANTDYTLNTTYGGINITSSGLAKVVDDKVFVDYTHVGRQFLINALQNPLSDYEIRFNAINVASPNVPVVVTIKRANIGITEEMSLLSTDMLTLTITGEMLPVTDGAVESQYFTIEQANAV